MHKTAIIFGSILGLLAVILGAFGAHALKEVLDPAQLLSFETAVKYQMYHAIVMILCGMLSQIFKSPWWSRAITCFIIGTLLFSGSIYLLVMLAAQGTIGLTGLGILTPIGGLFLIIGWAMMIMGATKIPTKK